jgi:hypothetical protein
MTRTIRTRRAEQTHQPLYARMLRLRHLAPSGLLCFVFLEGAVVLGILLALAELVSWWGVVVLPITVALMVKFNDLVAGAIAPRPAAPGTTSARTAVLRPAAMATPPEDEAVRSPEGFRPALSRAAGNPAPSAERPRIYDPVRTDRPGVYGSVTAERSAAYRPVFGGRSGAYGRPLVEASGGYGGPRGEASGGYGSLAAESAGVHDSLSVEAGGYGRATSETCGAYDPLSTEGSGSYDPSGTYGSAADEWAGVHGEGSDGRGPFSAERFGGSEREVTSADGRGGGFTPTAAPAPGGFMPAAMPLAGGYAPIVSPEPSTLGYESGAPGDLGYESGASGDGMSEAPAVGYPGSYSRGLSGSGYSSGGSGIRHSPGGGDGHSPGDGGYGDEGAYQVRSTMEPAVEEPRANNAPVRRAWADDLDVQQQMARQAASRRYE